MKQKPLHILFLEPCPVNFGGYFRANNICRYLAKAGNKVDLLITSNNKFSLKIIKRNISPGYTIYELPRFFVNQYLQGRLLRALISIIFALKKHYDVYHVGMLVEPETNIPALFLRLIGKKNIVMDWDEIYLNGFSDTNPIIHHYISLCEKYFPKIFPNFTATSELLLKIAKDRGAKNVIKIINGVDNDQIKIKEHTSSLKKVKLDPNYRYLLFIGNSVLGKRLLYLFNYLQHIVKLDNKIKLLVNFDYIKALKEAGYYKKYSASLFDHVINLGYISQSDLPFYFAAASATLFFSEKNQIEKANFPIRIGTYLASESLIVSNDINSEASNTLKEYRCAVIDKDLDMLPQLTLDVINNPNMMKNYLVNIKKAKKELSYQKLTKMLVSYYISVI